jgi:hypothetical protein
MTNLGLSPEEENQLKTISEYLFFDQFKDFVTYNRFEQCFQPLFNNIPISMDKVFKSICGEKKKYINYQRFVNSYLLYKNNDPKINPDLKTFFEKLFNSILKKENTFIGKPQEKTFSFTTPKACKKRDCITNIKILSDKEGAIHGLILEYDSIAKVKMYPSKIENNLVISLEMKLGLVDDKPIKEKQVGKLEGVKEEFFRDAATHVFGTISSKTNMINFFGFKCVSGKTVFVGYPEGDGFIFGKFGMKFHELKVQMSLDGIILLQPGFNTNRRTNVYLNTEANKLTKEDLGRDILIQDEAQLSQLNDAIQIDKMITTPIIEENHFFNENLADKITGNDYKEVVNQNPREWILKTEPQAPGTEVKILTVDDALKEVEKEKENTKVLLKVGLDGGELTAKGRKRRAANKSKNKKKKQRAKNGKLHETKSLVSNQKKAQQKWNGRTDQIKNISAISFLKNKDNYTKLKEKVGQGIQEELTKLKGNFATNIAQNLIKTIAPDAKKIVNSKASKSAKKVSQASKKKKNKKEKEKKTKLISKNMKGEVKKVIQRGEERSQSVQKPKIVTNIVITGDSDDTKDTNLFCSDAQQIVEAVENIADNSNVTDFFTGEKTRMRSTKSTDPQQNWRLFGSKIRRLSGVLLLQTIGCILKAIRALNDEIEGRKIMSLEERLKLFQLLDENEKIVDFLSSEEKENEKKEEESTTDNEKKNEKEEEDEDLLIPSEHPEDITSLPELETKMAQINKLLENKNLKPEDKKKLEQLKNLYLQQKNILIENKTEDAKEEVIKQNKIDVNKYLQEEQEKRKKAMEEAQRKIDEEMKKEKSKAKEATSINNIKQDDSIRIFRKQEFYKGTEPWTDPLFKPVKENLCPFDKKGWILPEDAIDDDVLGWESFKWCRVEEIFDSKNYSVFYEGIAVEDIVQGKISDCYFLSVLGSLCKFPKMVEKLFYFKEKTKEHIYGIYFYINGHKKLVLIDDYLPYVGVGFKQFAMSKSEENEIWVALMEKAWAKINGNYIRIGCGGSPNEAFDVLTEAYSEEVAVKPSIKDALWNKLIDGQKRGFIMTAGTSGNDDVEDVGLSVGHAFTVLGIHEIKGERVIRLRNPWGEGEFNGDWSDFSSKWTEELKQKYKYYEKEDGDFFMGYKDFLKYFVTMGFAKFHPDFNSSRLKIKKAEAIKCQLIKVTIPNDNTLVYFQLYGKNPRIPNKNGEYPRTSLSNLILVDKDFNYIEASAGNNMHICVESTLKKGDYYIFCDANFRYNDDANHGYTITAYSGVNIPMENVTNKNPVPDLLRKVVIDYCKKKEKANPQKNGVNVYVTKSFNKDIPYKVLTFENTSNNTFAVTVGIECKGSKSCCFYCDDVATESDTKVVKYVKGKETISIIIMYHSLSSLFNFNCTITEAKEQKDPVYNHAVFDEEGEEIDENGKLKQYILEKDDDSYYIGIDNTSTQKLKLKLFLEGLKVNTGPFKGQTSPVFEINPNERKVFEVLIITDDDISFRFDFA